MPKHYQLSIFHYPLLFRFFDDENLPTFVHAGFRVDAVRLRRFARGFVNVKLRNLQSIVSAALARARMRMASFRIWHDFDN